MCGGFFFIITKCFKSCGKDPEHAMRFEHGEVIQYGSVCGKLMHFPLDLNMRRLQNVFKLVAINTSNAVKTWKDYVMCFKLVAQA